MSTLSTVGTSSCAFFVFMRSRMLIHLVFLGVVLASASSDCPAKYARFTLQHSFCRDPNPTCSILFKGVDKNDRETILKVHNKLRSKIATGKESGLPSASNMLQMEWDSELAAVAQKWAEQCTFAHDCDNCRKVENFNVGQNMGLENWTCSTSACKEVKANWEGIITEFYNEVKVFDKKYINPYALAEEWGHFTQLVWADSWKVGCGLASFKNGAGAQTIYACNYGPGGNWRGRSMYEEGRPGSACPGNTCSACKTKGPTYLGLCKIKKSSLGPIYKNKNNLFYDCNWREGKSSCKVKETAGKTGWTTKKALSGSYKTITLNGGEKTQLELVPHIKPTSDVFCIVYTYRKGPAIASDDDSSKMTMTLSVPAAATSQTYNLGAHSKTDFVTIAGKMQWNLETIVIFDVSVPPGAPTHIIDLKEVAAYDGACKK